MTQSYTEKMVEDINNAPIPRDDMLALVEVLGDLAPEDRDMEGHMIHCVTFFDRGEKALSAHFRLMGLYRLVESENLPGWASDTLPDGSRRLHGALFVAAGPRRQVLLCIGDN